MQGDSTCVPPTVAAEGVVQRYRLEHGRGVCGEGLGKIDVVKIRFSSHSFDSNHAENMVSLFGEEKNRYVEACVRNHMF